MKGWEVPDGVSTFVLRVEISTEMKNVSLSGVESRTPARITKNSRTTAPILSQNRARKFCREQPWPGWCTCLQYERKPDECTNSHFESSCLIERIDPVE